MASILFATSNSDKFVKAQVNLQQFGVVLKQVDISLLEIQTYDGETIVRQKAMDAYEKTHQPVLTNDDSWSISALRGFPGTNMKQCNHYLLAEDWLRLMSGQTDRRLFLISHFAFHTGKEVKHLSLQEERFFLTKPQGHHKTAPHLEVISREPAGLSEAEIIAQGRTADESQITFWRDLAHLMQS